MKHKRIIIIVFLIIILGLASFAALDFMSKATLQSNQYCSTVRGFYDEKKDTLDGVFIGSSAAYRYWNAPKAYEDTGMCVYNFSTIRQPMDMAGDLMVEVEKYQKNTLFVLVDMRNVCKDMTTVIDDDARIVTDAMPYSANRKHTIDNFIDFYKDISGHIDEGPADYYLPMLRYHGAWIKDFNIRAVKRYLRPKWAELKGFNPHFATNQLEDKDYENLNEPLSEERIHLLDDLVEASKSFDFDVIFVASPAGGKEWRVGTLNSSCDYLERQGCIVLNFNKEPLKSQLDMNWQTDFYDEMHVSIVGAGKYTEFMCRYLKEHYDIPDHRGDSKYKSWDKAVEKLHSF